MNDSYVVAVAGGGSTYTTGIVLGLLSRQDELPVRSIRLYDIDGERQSKVAQLVRLIVRDHSTFPIEVIDTTDPETAFTNTDFVLAQIRSGGLKQREQDEKIPLNMGCVGQETCGVGGMSYGMRSIPDMIKIVNDVETHSPKAWVINYSNPASLVAEGLRRACPDSKVLNICDMPIAIELAVAKALGVDVEDLEPDYFGLNHFGWWQGLYHKKTGENLLKKAINKIQESGVYLPEDENNDASWRETFDMLRDMTADFPDLLPNTYLQYYLYPDKSVAKMDPNYTRANQVMAGREKDIFSAAEIAIEENSLENTELHLGVHGGYIVDVAKSIAKNEKKRMLVIVENKGAIPNMRDDAMVEIPCYITNRGPEPVRLSRNIPDFQKALMENQCACEKLWVDALFESSYQKALQAFTLNRTVPSAAMAKKLLDALIEANGELFPVLK